MAHLFFDLDRTLWHHERNHALFFQGLHSEMGWPGAAGDWAATYLATNDRLWDHIQAHNLGVDYVRSRRFPLLFREMGLSLSSVREAELLAAACEARIKERLPDMGAGYEGVPEACAVLRARGHRLHVITNGVAGPQERKIAALGLTDHFDVVMTSDAAQSYKPSGEIYRAALEAAGARASESWMIGDSLMRDILGGQQAGMRTAWFRAEDALPPDAEAAPDLEFGDWHAFPELLEGALQRG